MKKLYLYSLLTLFCFQGFAQSGFQNSFGDTTADFGTAILNTSQGMYCIVGSTYFHTLDSTEITIYFVDNIGDLIISSTVGLAGQDIPTSVVEAIDGNFIITGYTHASPLDSTHSDIFAIKVDNISGFELWAHFYGGQDDEKANAIVATPDGNYIIAGSTKSFGPFNQSALVIKIDDNGDLIWSKITGIGIETEYTSATISADTAYILCGNALDGNGSDHYISKFSSNGTLLWSNQVGSAADEFSNNISLCADSGFIIAGRLNDPLTASEDQLLTKLDSGGNFVWAKSYSTIRQESLNDVLQNADGNYMIVGKTNIDTTGLTIYQLTLAETDPSGNTIWSNTYGNLIEPSEGTRIIKSIDEGYACTGTTFGTGDPNGDAYLVKTDTAGETGCDEYPISFNEASINMSLINAGFEDVALLDTLLSSVNSNAFTSQYVQMCFWDHVAKINSADDIILFPNPATDRITLDGLSGNSFVTIYDQLGQTISKNRSSGNNCEIQTSEFIPGIYFVRIQSPNNIVTKKFIKE